MLRRVSTSIQTAVGTDLQKAVLKATNTDETLPKEKHVAVLIEYILHGNTRTLSEVFAQLQRRLTERNWIVVMKSLLVVRRILCEGGHDAAAGALNISNSLMLSSWSDNSTLKAQRHSRVLRHFGRYLTELSDCVVNVQDYLYGLRGGGGVGLIVGSWEQFRPRQIFGGEKEVLRIVSIGDNFLKALAALVKCEFNEIELCTPEDMEVEGGHVMMSVFLLCLKDGLGLYGILEEIRLLTLDHFFTLPAHMAETVLHFIMSFDECTHTLAASCALARDLSPIYADALPDLKPVSQGFISRLMDHVQSIGGNPHGAANSSKKSRPANPHGAYNDDDVDNVPVADLSSLLGPALLDEPVQPPVQPSQPQLLDFFDNNSNNNGFAAQSGPKPQQHTQPWNFAHDDDFNPRAHSGIPPQQQHQQPTQQPFPTQQQPTQQPFPAFSQQFPAQMQQFPAQMQQFPAQMQQFQTPGFPVQTQQFAAFPQQAQQRTTMPTFHNDDSFNPRQPPQQQTFANASTSQPSTQNPFGFFN